MAGIGVGGVASLSLVINIAWLPVPLDVALLLALLVAVPIWTAFLFFSFWASSAIRAWGTSTLILLLSTALNVGLFHAR